MFGPVATPESPKFPATTDNFLCFWVEFGIAFGLKIGETMVLERASGGYSGVSAMYIHLCRHAQAESNSVTGRDFDRPLTREGRLQARYLAGLLSAQLPPERPRRIVASPAVRAHQTAQTIADELGLTVTTLDLLLPACAAGEAIATLEDYAGEAPVLLVGHNPTVTAAVSILVHGVSAGMMMPGPALRTGQLATLIAEDGVRPGGCRLVELHRYEPAMVS